MKFLELISFVSAHTGNDYYDHHIGFFDWVLFVLLIIGLTLLVRWMIKRRKVNLSKTIKNLEKKGIVSRKPHPVIPFILALVALVLGIMIPSKTFSCAFFLIAGFSFIFAILHLIIVRVLDRKNK